MEIKELMLEVENSKNLVEFTSSDMGEVIKYFSALAGEITVSSIILETYKKLLVVSVYFGTLYE